MRISLLCSLAASLVFAPSVFAQNSALVYDDANVLIGAHADTLGSTVTVHTANGYRAALRVDGFVVSANDLHGEVAQPQLYYATMDCTDPGYFIYDPQHDPGIPFAPGGFVFRSNESGYKLYYVPKRAPIVSATIVRERASNGGCVVTAQAGARQDLTLAIPNDPNVTGVRNTTYTPPLRIEMLPLSELWLMFRDGFESSSSSQHLLCDGCA